MSEDYGDGISCLWMRGGTSKGAVFLASDLPADPKERNALLLRIMGSPDTRQIDGIGGGDPLPSKAAILSPSSRPDADVDRLLLQVFVDQAVVFDAQGCGKFLAAVGPRHRARPGGSRRWRDARAHPYAQHRRGLPGAPVGKWRDRRGRNLAYRAETL